MKLQQTDRVDTLRVDPGTSTVDKRSPIRQKTQFDSHGDIFCEGHTWRPVVLLLQKSIVNLTTNNKVVVRIFMVSLF